MKFKQALKNMGVVVGRYLGVVAMFSFLILCIVAVSAGFIYKTAVNYSEEVIKEADFENFSYQPSLTTQIYSKQGTLLAEIYNENRRYVTYDEIPDSMVNALVSVEDRRFYEHPGVDPFGVGRALLTNLKSGGKSQGASTLTQQVTRGLFLSSTKTWERKIKEIILSVQLEGHYDKHKIAEIYLNEMYLGHRAYGVESASRTYFNKSIKNVTMDEATLLAGLFQLPSSYDPLKYPERATKRRLAVLDSMKRDGMLTTKEVNEIKDKPLKLKNSDSDSRKVNKMIYPYFTRWAIDDLEKQYGDKIFSSGWKIYTTIDDKAQQLAEKTAKEKSDTFRKNYNAKDIAIVSTNPKNGELIAMVGGSNFNKNEINMAVKPRQPGSTMKSFVYASGIDAGIINDSSIILDEPIDINGYSPKNDDNQYRGYMTVRDALRLSDNIVAVKTAQLINTENIRNFTKKLGVTSLSQKDQGLGVALGGLTKGISPYQMATAYGVFGNDGLLAKPHYIAKITDQKGRIIEQFNEKPQRVIQSETAAEMTDMLQDVVSNGTGTPAQIGRPVAGKTGTTNGSKDLWFVGYTPSISTAVWVGNSDSADLRGGFGGSTSGRAWADYMSAYLKNTPVENFAPKPPLVSVSLMITKDGTPMLPGTFCRPTAEGIPDYEQDYVVKNFIIQEKHKPTETAACEPVSETDYITELLKTDGGLETLIQEGKIDTLIQMGYIKLLVDKGMLEELVSSGYQNQLIKAGYKQQLIDKGYLTEEPVENNKPQTNPVPAPISGTPNSNPAPDPIISPEEPKPVIENPIPEPEPSQPEPIDNTTEPLPVPNDTETVPSEPVENNNPVVPEPEMPVVNQTQETTPITIPTTNDGSIIPTP